MKTMFALMALLAMPVCYGQGIPVLEYHNIVKLSDGIASSDMVVNVETFTEQMKWLHDNHYTTITAAELVQYMNGSLKLEHPDKTVVISFDDGYLNQQNALPALNQYGFKGTFSIIASYAYGSPGYMNWDQVRALANSGHDVESHSMTHPEQMQEEYYFTEIRVSKSVIEREIGKKVTVITWPNGKFNPTMVTVARDSNYLGALTIDQDWCTSANKDISSITSCTRTVGNAVKQDSFQMKRFFIDGRCTANEIGQEVKLGHTIQCAFDNK